MTRKQAKIWQLHSGNLKTPKVQLWNAHGSFMGIITLETAVKMVEVGKCYIISEQAIGYLEQP